VRGSYKQGQKKAREVIAHYRQRFPSAMKCMEETLDACLQALRLPQAHHKRLRTSNLLERTFGEHKRRTKVIPHFFTEGAAMKLSYAVLLAVTNKWRGVRMDVFTTRQLEELRREVLPENTPEESAA
jgi:transposase-like protein